MKCNLPTIVFRVDASVKIASGHVMRCLALAERLQKKAKIIFISRNLNGNLNRFISKKYTLWELPYTEEKKELLDYSNWLSVDTQEDARQTINLIRDKDIDWLVIDHYGISEEWEKIVRPYVKSICVIDDLANRKHDCEMLIDQNYYANKKERYVKYVPRKCKLILGPENAILRKEFYLANKCVWREKIENIFIFFGGSDLCNNTLKTLRALTGIHKNRFTINVVVGKNNVQQDEISKYCRFYRYINLFYPLESISSLMNKADLAIGAGGITTWERCYLWLPSMVIIGAENQRRSIEDSSLKGGFLINLGMSDDVDEKCIKQNVEKCIKQPRLLFEMREKCKEVMENKEKELIERCFFLQ